MNYKKDKPDYYMPSMAEIALIPKNGIKVASLFSGCGGSSLGYKLAGCEVVYAAEFVEEAIACYQANHSTTKLDTRDVRDIAAKDIVAAVGKIDILDGSPPCTSFSSAGSGDKGWGKKRHYSGKKSQKSDDLFFEYSRILKELQPKGFIAENVAGLVKGKAKGYFVEIVQALKDCGYSVICSKIDCQYLRVPQMRDRVFFMGIRKDLKIQPVFPRPLPYTYSVKDVLPHIRYVKHSGSAFNYKSSDRPSPTIMAHDYGRFESAYFSGGGWIKSDTGETRQFTIPELKKICSFPDDFYLGGTDAENWERLGRAVPPLAMSAIAGSLCKRLLQQTN
jgi:DNA (cytosine-5)-methyltransferase 1